LAATATLIDPGVYLICVCAGKDATQDFEEIGHSKSARDMLDKYLIGAFAVSLSCSSAAIGADDHSATKPAVG
jgi:cytochrome b involved in lipid metabolism